MGLGEKLFNFALDNFSQQSVKTPKVWGFRSECGDCVLKTRDPRKFHCLFRDVYSRGVLPQEDNMGICINKVPKKQEIPRLVPSQP